MLRAFKSDDLVTRELAIRAVGSIDAGTKDVLDALIEVLNDGFKDLRADAVNALGSLGESAKPALPALLKALEDKDIVVRRNAIGALQSVGAGAKAAPAISRLLRDEGSSIRASALGYLRQLKPGEAKETVPALIALLKDAKYNKKYYAVLALQHIGPDAKEAIPVLTDLLRKSDVPGQCVLEALRAIDPDGKR